MVKSHIEDAVILVELYDFQKNMPLLLKLLSKSWAHVFECNSVAGKGSGRKCHLIALAAREQDTEWVNLKIIMQRKIGDVKPVEKKITLKICTITRHLPSTFFSRFFSRIEKLKSCSRPMHILSLNIQHGAMIFGFFDWLSQYSPASQQELPEFRMYVLPFY